MITQSPWRELPHSMPYIIPTDLEKIKNHKLFNNVRTSVYPEPIVGGLNNAKVLLLAKAPSFDEIDLTTNMLDNVFKDAVRANLEDPYKSDFYYFKDNITDTSGNKWWDKNLKHVIDAGVTRDDIRRNLMCIDYFPYHVDGEAPLDIVLPSQEYSFEIVREAIRRKMTIILATGQNLWLNAVPELNAKDTYKIKLTNPQNIIITSVTAGNNLNFRAIIQELKR